MHLSVRNKREEHYTANKQNSFHQNLENASVYGSSKTRIFLYSKLHFDENIA